VATGWQGSGGAVPAHATGEAALFARLGIRREEDLALHLPIRYENETRVTPIAAAGSGRTVQVEGVVVHSEIVARGRRALLVELRDDSGTITLRFFHFYGSQLRQFAAGRRVRAYGEVRGGLFGPEMAHPRYRLVSEGEALPQSLTPVYPTVSGLGQGRLRAAILRVLDTLEWPETVAPEALRALGLPATLEALRAIHRPAPDVPAEALQERTTPAWRRVIFDELLAQQLSLARARAVRAGQRAPALPEDALARRLVETLPFALTGAQQRVWREIGGELAAAQPMNRLLQGDVGSGKTVIAALAAAQAIGSGWQAALMAPTEILAEQHLRKLEPWLARVGARIAWLSGSLRESDKRAVRARVAAGEVVLLIGTHALIEDTVAFARLGLVIVDEQHRFGVAQRLALRARHEGAAMLPHQLMMSATPIPRTLAMSYYADLDVSVIDELPPGRKPVTTKLISAGRREQVIARVRAAAAAGRQAYWVCPLIEESETLDLQTAIETHAALQAELAPYRIGLVHGRLPAPDKQAVMSAFCEGRLQVLVATTVIEVGVDVPAATLMIVEHAERFGLAQLHQLRGRVGRGAGESTCVLMYRPPLSAAARERLKTMYESADGFEIARRDLAQRGPGEFLGARQSGEALLRFADLERDGDLLEAARRLAARMLREQPDRVQAHLQRWLGGREEFLRA